MKKKAVVYLLVAVMAMTISGCSGKSAEEKSSEAETSSEEAKTTEADTVEDTDSEEGSEELELLRKYVDVDAYIAGEGMVDANVSDEISEEMQVDGHTLRIGMGYDEVLAEGFTPTDDAFSQEEAYAVAVTCDFTTDQGKTARLGFICEEGQTVADGVLYSVNVQQLKDTDETTVPAYSVMGISGDTTIPEIVSVLGEPYQIEDPAWSDFLNVGFEYNCKETSRYLTFYVNLDTEEIVSATLEGYAE